MRRMLLALFAACVEAPRAWIAPTDDARMTLGVTVSGDEVRAYACGEDELLEGSRWFGGVASDGVFVAEDAAGWAIDVDLAAATGTLRSPSATYAWTGAAVTGDDGLYEGGDDGCAAGVLVAGETVRGTWCDAAGAYAQVEPPDTLVPDDEGALEVRAYAPDGWRTFRVYAVFPR